MLPDRTEQTICSDTTAERRLTLAEFVRTPYILHSADCGCERALLSQTQIAADVRCSVRSTLMVNRKVPDC